RRVEGAYALGISKWRFVESTKVLESARSRPARNRSHGPPQSALSTEQHALEPKSEAEMLLGQRALGERTYREIGEDISSFMNQAQKVQEFWDRRPCNIMHSPKILGTREYFDEVEARRYMVEPHIPLFAEFDRWRGKKVLEVGCGIGTDSIRFAHAGAELTAVDLSPRSLEIARQRFEIHGLKANLYCGSAEHLTSLVPVERFDLIYSFGVIHHTHHPEKVLAELKNYCGPATELRIMLYSKWSWKVFWIIAKYGKGAFWRADELVQTYSEAQTGCPVTFY